jgi:sugar/nucleoside kinase (ribokinase family)
LRLEVTAEPATRSGIICAGAWCVDRNTVIDHWPAEETVAKILSVSRQGGCSSHNMATALKRLGAPFPVEAIGLIGDDDEGRLLAQMCDDLGIDRQQLELRAGAATSVSHVMIAQGTGKRSFFYSAGTHAVQTPDSFDFSKTRARIVHLGMPGIHEIIDAPWQGEVSGWVTILKAAQAHGLKTNIELVSIGAARIRQLAEPLLPYLDTLIINDLEAGAVVGLDTVLDGATDIGACRQAASLLLERSRLWLVAIHFPAGGIVMTRDGRVFERPSVRVPPSVVRSSNGAGDAFAAGMLYGIHEAWPLERGLELAHATAAASLRSDSTTSAIPPWPDCLQLAKEWGWREGLAL